MQSATAPVLDGVCEGVGGGGGYYNQQGHCQVRVIPNKLKVMFKAFK